MLAQRQLALAQATVEAESLRLEVVRTLDTWLVVGHQESVFILDNKCGDPVAAATKCRHALPHRLSAPLKKHGEDGAATRLAASRCALLFIIDPHFPSLLPFCCLRCRRSRPAAMSLLNHVEASSELPPATAPRGSLLPAAALRAA